MALHTDYTEKAKKYLATCYCNNKPAIREELLENIANTFKVETDSIEMQNNIVSHLFVEFEKNQWIKKSVALNKWNFQEYVVMPEFSKTNTKTIYEVLEERRLESNLI